MTIELLQTLSLVSFIVAGVLLLLTIALFFLLEVPKLFGDVTGSTAKKAIEAIRQQNESIGDKTYKSASANGSRKKKFNNPPPSGKAKQKSNSTELFNTAELAPKSSETTVLESAETTVLGTGSAETTVLGSIQNSGETTVLAQNQIISDDVQNGFGDGLTVDVEMGFSGSNEIIE